MMRRLLFFCVLLASSLELQANSSVRVHPLYIEKAYRQDYDESVMRDRDGYLWISTNIGLKRYDGYGVRVFQHDPEDPTTLGSPNMMRTFVQADGTFWALGSALNRYNRKTESFTRYFISDYRVMYAVENADNGGLWIGGDRLGLMLFDPVSGEVTQRFLVDGDEPLSVFQIIRDPDTDTLWLASSTGVLKFDPSSGESTTYFTLSDTIRNRSMVGLARDSLGVLWISTRNGLFELNPATRELQHHTAKPGVAGALGTNDLTAINTDSNDNLWIGTEKQGVYRRDPDTGRFFHYPASDYDEYRFPPASISSIYEDGRGSIWFTCGQHGVFRISKHLQKFHSFRHSFDTKNSLSFNHISGMFEDSKGNIWLGTDGNGVDRFDPRNYTFENFRHDPNDPETLGANAVMAIAEDRQGAIWLGTWAGGLNRLDPQTGKVTRYLHDPRAPDDQTLAENHIFRIHIDAKGRLVMAVGGSGVQIFDPATGRFQRIPTYSPANPHGLRNEHINDIEPTPEGDYWIGGYQGLELFYPESGRTWVPNITLHHAILDLHLSRDGLLWIATDHGLFHLNPATGELQHFSTKDGLVDEYIVGIEEDALGFLWLATRNGLTRFDPISKAMESFDQYDGLAGVQFNRFAHLRTRDGLLYFGTNQGFSYFDPTHLPRNEYAPQVHFTELRVNHQLQYPGQSPWLERALNFTEHLVLPSTADDIRISFTATNLIAPIKNRYRYRLLGRSDQWIETSEQRNAQYSNLPPGTYSFQLIASNNDGVWTGTTRELSITILPAWWQTWWAFTLYFVLFIGCIYGFSVWRLHLTVKRRLELEQQVSEQTGKLMEANRVVSQLNSELEQRVAQRTRDLSAEIEERKESEEKATYIAYHDTLSGLYNRAWLLQHLEALMHGDAPASDSAPSQSFAILFVGGDRFRAVNENYGHQTGDKLLVNAAGKLRELCPEPAQVVRLGSDEFVVVLDSVSKRDQVAALADNIVSAFKEPFAIDHFRLTFSVSIGYVITNNTHVEPTQVLRDANIAMQKAKECGRGRTQEFDDELLQQKLDKAALEADLKLALAREEFSVVYQPIITLNSMAATDFEVLIRWRHPQRGMVPPDKFIPMAEASGLIFEIGLWVLEQACQQLKTWQEMGCADPLPVVAVNLSPVQLEREDFLCSIDNIFQRTGISPTNIEFEITETALLRHTDTVNDTLEALRQRGIRLAIDDFGTGYSSLSYLDKLPVQVLKIDRSFVNALTENDQGNHNASEIVRATIALAHNLGMLVVAEGIETADQLALLKAFSCDFGQGYFFARPLTADDATSTLQQSRQP